MVSRIPPQERFRQAAWAYFFYGLCYWLGAVHLGRQESVHPEGRYWYWIGAVIIVIFPWLIASGTRGGFYLWFSRILTLFMTYRIYGVGKVAFSAGEETVPLPWGGGEISLRLGAIVFLGITLVALAVLARAAWFTRPKRP